MPVPDMEEDRTDGAYYRVTQPVDWHQMNSCTQRLRELCSKYHGDLHCLVEELEDADCDAATVSRVHAELSCGKLRMASAAAAMHAWDEATSESPIWGLTVPLSPFQLSRTPDALRHYKPWLLRILDVEKLPFVPSAAASVSQACQTPVGMHVCHQLLALLYIQCSCCCSSQCCRHSSLTASCCSASNQQICMQNAELQAQHGQTSTMPLPDCCKGYS